MNIIFAQLTWILSGIGVPAVVGLALLARRLFKITSTPYREQLPPYIGHSSLVEIDIIENDGQKAIYTKSVRAVSQIDTLHEIHDFVSVAGRSTVTNLEGVEVLRTEDILGAGQRQVLRLRKTFNKGDSFDFSIERELEGTFTNSTEYWEPSS